MKKILHVLTLVLLLGSARADLRLQALFTDHAVLQREVAVPVWGWDEAGSEVTVEFAGQKKTATAGTDGLWKVVLDPLPASAESRDLTVSTSNPKSKVSSIKCSDVVVGEVWVASGQSNMGFPLSASHNAAEVLPQAADPLLRQFNVAKKTAAEFQTDVAGKWDPSTPDTAKGFSGVAYFFGRDLRQKLQVPVAIVNASWGGTAAQSWVSLDGLRKEPPITRHLEAWEKALEAHRKSEADSQIGEKYKTDLKTWQTDVEPAYKAALKAYTEAGAVGPKPKPPTPEPSNPDPIGPPSPSARPGVPTVIYNAMIAPLMPYAIRGVIWYQGEANGGAGLEYRTLFPRLIQDWRAHWGQGDFPFFYVQLPGWDFDKKNPPPQQDWPWLREAQLFTLAEPNTGMAVGIDVGDPGNVHPGDKLDIGLRLARLARKKVYGEELVANGPLYKDFVVEGSTIRMRFTETGSGLVPGQAPWLAKGVEAFPTDRLIGFSVAGSDHQWMDAEAKIDGTSVVVSSPSVVQPVAVRYGWANSPRCNLYNKEGLPASPFRTDDWTKAQPLKEAVKTE